MYNIQQPSGLARLPDPLAFGSGSGNPATQALLKNKRFVIKTKILWEEVSDISGKNYLDLE